MFDDYRNTKYCLVLDDINSKKRDIVALVKKDFPKAEDMHEYIHKNDDKYKFPFMKVYNCKCAYCGISIDLITKKYFEIDHYIYEKSPKFVTKKDAGYIENLILACHDCNHKKGSFVIPEEDFDKLYPDTNGIRSTFYRDDMFYIQISNEESNNQTVKMFYQKLKLGSEVHRLDFLLMSMIGLQKKFDVNSELHSKLGQIIEMLRIKRNIM